MSLTNLEQIIRTYMEQALVEQYPEIAASGSTLLDLSINPLIQITKPLIMLLNKMDLMQSLDNAHLMTAEDLDNIGLGNYGIPRIAGARAYGYVYVEMEPQYVGPEPVIIYPIVVSTSDGLQFNTNTNTIIKYAETDIVNIEGTELPGIASDYLNSSTGKYEFPVRVEAEEAGSDYNIEANTVTILVTKYPLLTGIVNNKQAFKGGVARESNVAYALRLKQKNLANTGGVSAWYRNYLINKFQNVYDVYVAGMGNPLMQRDNIIVRINGEFIEKHIGGKVDLYIKGADIAYHDQLVYTHSDKIRLYNSRLKEYSAIVINNITNPSNNDLAYELTYEFPDTREGWIDVRVVAGPSSILPEAGDELEVRYISYIDDSYTDTFVYMQNFYFNSDIVRIERTPFKTFTAIMNNTTNKEIPLDFIVSNDRVLPIIEVATCPDQTGVGTDGIILNPDTCLKVDNYYTNHTITLFSGTGEGQARTITSFEASTCTATVDSPWDIIPDNTTVYSIKDYTNDVENSAKDRLDIVLDMSATYPDTMELMATPGDLLSISYAYNKLITDIQDDSDIYEFRGITADVLSREAIPVYVYMGMEVRCKYGRLISNEQKVVLQQAISDMIVATEFNSSLDASDMIGLLYQTPEVTSFLDFVRMPVIMFATSSFIEYSDEELLAITGTEYLQSNIVFEGAQYPILAKCVIRDYTDVGQVI